MSTSISRRRTCPPAPACASAKPSSRSRPNRTPDARSSRSGSASRSASSSDRRRANSFGSAGSTRGWSSRALSAKATRPRRCRSLPDVAERALERGVIPAETAELKVRRVRPDRAHVRSTMSTSSWPSRVESVNAARTSCTTATLSVDDVGRTEVDVMLAQPAAACGPGRDPGVMKTVYEAVGGIDGLVRLAGAWHTRVMADEVVSHAFSHGYHPEHTERLAAYWAEALGGPATYSESVGDETSVVRIHSGNGPHEDMDQRA